MKKAVSKILALAMAAVMAFSVSPALTAEAANKDLGSQTLYMRGKNSSSSVSFSIDNITSVSKVKSSNPSVMYVHNYDIHNYEYWYDWEQKGTYKKNGGQNYVSFYSNPKKAGSSVITVTSGKNTYTKKINVLKYVNPIKMLTISNVNGGKNIAGKFKNQYDAKLKAKKADTIKVNATANSGWEIYQISINNTYYDQNSSSSVGAGTYRYFKAGTTTAKHSMGSYNYSQSGSVTVYCRNKSNGAQLEVCARLNQE